MNNKYISFICIMFLISLNLSFRWPVENGRITSTFGESRGDHFHDGIDMVSPDQNIYPTADGDVVYYWDKSIFPTENYPGGGNYKVIKHNNNIYSLYMHLVDGFQTQKRYSKNEVLGIIGNTGHSFGKHLHFSLLKIDERKSINPFLILPKVKDSKKPKISNFYIKVGKKYYVINNNTKIRLTRHYPLLVSIIDSIKKNERLGIFKLKAIFNRKTVMDVMFSDIDFSKNGLTIDNNKYNDLLDVKGYYKVKDMTYKQGLNRLKIIAKDFYGNISTKEVSFNVKLEIAQD